MKIRWKFMIVLLCVSLAPMILMRLNGQRALRELGNELASSAAAGLIQKTRVALKRLVEDHARVLKRERDLLEMTLYLISTEIPERLSGKRQSPDGDRFSAGGDPSMAQSSTSDGAKRDEVYCIVRPSGKCLHLSVDFSRQKIDIEAGKENSDGVLEAARRLESMVPAYRFLKAGHPELILWVHARLENGIGATYPAPEHMGGFHMGRARKASAPDWYELARTAKGAAWSKPSPDPLTGNLVFHVTRALRDANGQFIGAAAIAVPLTVFLHENEHVKMLSEHVTSLLVKASGTPERPLKIIGRENPEKPRHMHWHAAGEDIWLESPDKSQLVNIAQDLENHRSNVREILYDGVLHLAAYQSFDEYGAALLLLVPETDILSDAVAMENYVRDRIDRQIFVTGIVLISVALLTVLLSYILARSFTIDISRVADAVDKVAAGDFSARVGLRTRDELGKLGQKFDKMIPSLEEHVQMKQALDVAMKVQQNLFPRALPVIEGLDVAAKSVYCSETGGDFYDFIHMRRAGEKRMAVAVGDVSGHGLSAALLMATSRAFLRSRATQSGQMEKIISDVNRLVARDTSETSQFVTLFYLEIDPGGKKFRWIRAGHDPAILYDPKLDEFTSLDDGGPALGVMKDFQFKKSKSLHYAAGQILLIGTDGVWETVDQDGKMFGKDKVEFIVRKNADKTAKEIMDAVVSEVSVFRKDRVQEDDVTLIVLKAN